MRNTSGVYAKPSTTQINVAFNLLEARQASRRRRGLDGSMMSRLDWRMRKDRLRHIRAVAQG